MSQIGIIRHVGVQKLKLRITQTNTKSYENPEFKTDE